MKMPQFKYHWDNYAKTPYIVNGKQWLAIEDRKSVRVGEVFLTGLMIWGRMFVNIKKMSHPN